MMGGVILESIRVTKDAKVVLIITFIAYLLSFAAFIPFKNEEYYSFSSHFEVWPFVFLFLFLIGGLTTWGNKTMTKLTEGITLIQSISILYYILTFEEIVNQHWIIKIIILLFIITTIFPLYHAFSYQTLSRRNRLLLSIYSSVIMLIFAIDNCSKVLSGNILDNTLNLNEQIINALNYFLLGISSIYLLQNFLMIINYFGAFNLIFPDSPSKKKYKEEFLQLNEEHISRYSDEQVNILHSIYCLLFTVMIFATNYFFELVAPVTAIWIVFFTFPLLIKLIRHLENKKKAA